MTTLLRCGLPGPQMTRAGLPLRGGGDLGWVGGRVFISGGGGGREKGSIDKNHYRY